MVCYITNYDFCSGCDCRFLRWTKWEEEEGGTLLCLCPPRMRCWLSSSTSWFSSMVWSIHYHLLIPIHPWGHRSWSPLEHSSQPSSCSAYHRCPSSPSQTTSSWLAWSRTFSSSSLHISPVRSARHASPACSAQPSAAQVYFQRALASLTCPVNPAQYFVQFIPAHIACLIRSVCFPACSTWSTAPTQMARHATPSRLVWHAPPAELVQWGSPEYSHSLAHLGTLASASHSDSHHHTPSS